MSIRDEALAAANDMPQGYGIITEIAGVLELLFSMWSMCAANQNIPGKTLVTARIRSGDPANPESVTFRPGAVHRERRRVRAAAAQQGKTGLTKDQLDEYTVRGWRRVLQSDDGTVASCCLEGAAYGIADPGEANIDE